MGRKRGEAEQREHYGAGNESAPADESRDANTTTSGE